MSRYPTDEDRRKWYREWVYSDSDLMESEFMVRRACDWQRERDAEICEELSPGCGDAVSDAKSEALSDAAAYIRQSKP